MEKCVEILGPKLGEKGATDFINFMIKLDDNREIKSRVSNFLDPTHKQFDAVIKFLTQANINSKLHNEPHEKQKNQKVKTPPKSDVSSAKRRQKPKFVPLFQEGAKEGFVTIIPGRYPCQCLATVHKLVNNCMHCGRIVCNQEGSGLCYFCGNMVCTTEELNTINSGSKAGQKLKNRLLNTPWNEGVVPLYKTKQADIKDDTLDVAQKESEDKLVAAILHRDKLVTADSQAVTRNKVIDDELDYFASESGYKWLTPDVRDRVSKRIEELKSKRHAPGFGASKLTIDFAGRKVEHHDDRLEKIDQLFSQEPILEDVKKEATDEPVLRTLDHLEYSGPKPKTKSPKVDLKLDHSTTHRIQDIDMTIMKDNGLCLSMHQPWASLLVLGIKKHEGRTWYSAHRGPLWIAAAAKEPEKSEIEEVEQFYISRGVDKSLLPSAYPTGCILGSVNVIDVLPLTNYLEQYPDGESSCPFVFICDNPHELLFKLPVKGKHKIFKLDADLFRSITSSLM